MDDRSYKFSYHFFLAAALLISAYIFLYAVLEQGVFSHCDYDSYTRQAAAWWQGSACLPENISWLEIAEYQGEYFISFPPFPSVIQFLLYPIFGLSTPDNLINTLFAIGAFILIYRFLMRRGYGGLTASVIALLFTLGSNLFYLSLTGWVWFSAQTQSFFFSVLCVYLLFSKKQIAWYVAFLCLGIAFACRPFQIVYFPLVLYMIYNNSNKGRGAVKTLLGSVKYVLPLVFIGICAAVYNDIRFDSFFEFGHNYLPEFAHEPQFSLAYVPGNFFEILKLPSIENGQLTLPMFNGTLFFLVNPVYILLAVCLIRQNFGVRHTVYLICLTAHFVLMLAHKTMGGWQFGSRYLVDMIPFMLVILADERRAVWHRSEKAAILPTVLAAIGIAVNIYGAVWYYTMV